MYKNSRNTTDILELRTIGNDMYELMERLYPITRSITGEGVRKTLKIFQDSIDLQIKNLIDGKDVN